MDAHGPSVYRSAQVCHDRATALLLAARGYRLRGDALNAGQASHEALLWINLAALAWQRERAAAESDWTRGL